MTSIHTKLLILADDLTGALDSGVQLSRKGDKVLIRTDIHHVFENTDADVLVVDTETRHIPAEDAYRIVYDLSKAHWRQALTVYIRRQTPVCAAMSGQS